MVEHNELDALVDRLLELSELPCGFRPDPKQDAILVGFLLRCRAHLRALRTLIREDLEDACDPLVRVTLELAITGLWLMANPQENFPRVLGAFRRDWQLLREDHERYLGTPLPDDSEWGPLVDPENPTYRSRRSCHRCRSEVGK